MRQEVSLLLADVDHLPFLAFLTTAFIHPKLSLLKKPLVAASGHGPPMVAVDVLRTAGLYNDAGVDCAQW
jgi:hypothetical protein